MPGTFKIFIIEDDKIFSRLLDHHLSHHEKHDVETFSTGKEALQNLYKNPDMVSLDINLPDIQGLEVLKRLKEYNKDLPVIVVSGQEDLETAIRLFQNGIYDYIIKGEDAKERLWNAAKNIRDAHYLKRKVDALEEEVGKKYEFGKLIKGDSVAIKKIFALIEKGAKTNITVSISGETGTGKELVAKSIHFNSPRAKNPFVAINVSAIPSELIESELFGHERGAFTGAIGTRIGKFEEAHKGTLFLDEIGDMDLSMQTKLLRVLQEEEVHRIGSNKRIKLNVRVIVATNKNLRELVKEGKFREDLYFRLLGLPIEIPPLRERDNDSILLAKFFVEDFCKKNKLGQKSISPEAIEKIKKYHFPGNVREIKAIMELAAVMSSSDVITEEDVIFTTTDSISNLLMEEKSLEEYNNMIVRHFMEKYDNRVREVANRLGIGKTTIYRMMKEKKL
jgi:DNA-binding NtrC family response regulator